MKKELAQAQAAEKEQKTVKAAEKKILILLNVLTKPINHFSPSIGQTQYYNTILPKWHTDTHELVSIEMYVINLD